MAPHRLKRLLHPLDAGFVASEARRIVGKYVRKARRTDLRSISLEPEGEPRGSVLFSYVLDPFLLPPGAPVPNWHTHFWESFEMGHAFRDAGYRVDVISWTNQRFEPEREYDVLIDVRTNLERLAPRLGTDALRVLHIDTAHWTYHNRAQERRRAALATRRGIELELVKLVPENRAIESADVATVLGNEFTQETYAFAETPLVRIPISTPRVYPYPTGRSWDHARKRFLWLGSGGLLHKGLDLVLDAFAGMPEMELVVCGPIRKERQFERAYFTELYETPSIRTLGWVDVTSHAFEKLAARCLGMVYPSCSEGGGGSVINAMHAGLVPVASRESSVDVAPDCGVVLEESTVPEIQDAVRDLAARPAEQLEEMARGAWSYAREHHTRERFSVAYRRFVEHVAAGTWRSIATLPKPSTTGQSA